MYLKHSKLKHPPGKIIGKARKSGFVANVLKLCYQLCWGMVDKICVLEGGSHEILKGSLRWVYFVCVKVSSCFAKNKLFSISFPPVVKMPTSKILKTDVDLHWRGNVSHE